MPTSWRLKIEQNIGILELDEPGTGVNVLTPANLTELNSLLEDISKRADLKALLVASAKKNIFIAGADIREIQNISSEAEAFEKAEQGKKVFEAFGRLKIPTVAVINGACLGGGFELALACRYRTAAFSDKVRIGLPEVNLGILPGFGGSIRLPRLIGLTRSLPLILGGTMLAPEQALKQGLVDKLFHERTLREDSIQFVKDLLFSRPVLLARRKEGFEWFLEETPPGRWMVFRQASINVENRAKGFYPAPYKILELIKATYGRRGPEVYREESEAFSKLAVTPVSKNLIKVFFTSERYKKRAWTKNEQKVPRVNCCGVLGAGVMGGGIAQRVSERGILVRVRDIQKKALGHALKEARRIYEGAVGRKKMKRYEAERKMGLISVGLGYEGFKRCDFVIEAVVEDLKIKQDVFRETSRIVSPSAVLASNTSSLPVTKIAETAIHPERVVGLHFFNPVHRMPLVEVIRARQTSDETLERAIRFARDLGKTVILVEDSPGFLVNRLLVPYLNEAAYLMEEGVSPETLDRIATSFGMPMGPIELVDQVGIDVSWKVAHILQEAFGERMKVAGLLEKVKNAGLLGRKSGRGFYLYHGGRKKSNPEIVVRAREQALDEKTVLKRMMAVMINEAARCLEEKIVDGPETVDIGMMMGAGFPPFRGGMLHYAGSVGLGTILRDLEQFQQSVNRARFEPGALIRKLASENRDFYSQTAAGRQPLKV